MPLIRVTPDKKKALSILKMVDTTLEMIGELDLKKFPSNITKEYYDVIREMTSVILLLDGYSTYGAGAHTELIEYIANNKLLNEYELSLTDDLRITRNKISYDWFFVHEDYIKRKVKDIKDIVRKLRSIIERRM